MNVNDEFRVFDRLLIDFNKAVSFYALLYIARHKATGEKPVGDLWVTRGRPAPTREKRNQPAGTDISITHHFFLVFCELFRKGDLFIRISFRFQFLLLHSRDFFVFGFVCLICFCVNRWRG